MEENNLNENIEKNPPAGGEKGFKKYLFFAWELFKIAIIALVIVLPIRYFLFQPFIVKGESMHPNFESGDYLIIDEISYRFSEPERGDVVVFKTDFIPGYSGQRFIKRIVGLPGETAQIKAGKVYITDNGKTVELSEKYLLDSLETQGDIIITLKSDQYFVLGDNRQYSYDSRAWGVVPKKDIIGKAFLRIFPVAALSQISNPSY